MMQRRSRPVRETRRDREARGRSAEALATFWLRLRGYRVLRRRLKTPLGEIDIVARRGSVLAIIEVKARGNLPAGLQALTAAQRRRIERATAWLLANGFGDTRSTVRFDLMVVRPFRLPVHVTNAWTPASGFL